MARESGALTSVLDMLWQPDMKEAVQQSALRALTDFVSSCHENTKAAVEIGAIEEVLNALKFSAGCEFPQPDGDVWEVEDEPSSPKAGKLRKSQQGFLATYLSHGCVGRGGSGWDMRVRPAAGGVWKSGNLESGPNIKKKRISK